MSMLVKLTRITNEPVLAIEEAASNCYDSTPSKDGKIIKHCVSSGHTSVTEFATFTFHIEGVSRSLLAQLTRHRHAGYAVRSQRYCNEDGFEYIIPPSIERLGGAYLRDYQEFMDNCRNLYNQLQEAGVPKEDARYILPNACETELEMTMNLRALMNFMNERLCTRAQWEIRELAKQMKKLIVEKVPEFEPYLVPKCEKHGKGFEFCTEARSCGRHRKLSEIFEDSHSYRNLCGF